MPDSSNVVLVIVRDLREDSEVADLAALEVLRVAVDAVFKRI